MQAGPLNFADRHSYVQLNGQKVFNINQKDHEELQTYFHYTPEILKERIKLNGVIYSHIKYSRAAPTSARVIGCACCFFTTIVCFICLPCICNKDTLHDFCLDPITGEHKFQALLKHDKESEQLRRQDLEELGLDYSDPKQTESAQISKWIEKHREKIVTVRPYTHQYIPLYLKSGASAIFFIPHGNIKNSIFSRLSAIQGGGALNTRRLHDLAVKYAMTYKPGQKANRMFFSKNSETTPLLQEVTTQEFEQ